MVLTAAQTTAFFENPGQMAIPHVTRAQLLVQGITSVDDLEDVTIVFFSNHNDNLWYSGTPPR